MKLGQNLLVLIKKKRLKGENCYNNHIKEKLLFFQCMYSFTSLFFNLRVLLKPRNSSKV